MVFIFIIATVGLLVWAAVRPWVRKWIDVSTLQPSRSARMSGESLTLSRLPKNAEAIYLLLVAIHDCS